MLEQAGQPLAGNVPAPPAGFMNPIEERIADRARQRTHETTYVFSVCPAPELLINTTQFWKTQEAKGAFAKMYAATHKELKRFSQIVMSERVRMLRVQPNDEVIPFSDF